jgi:sialic acid synthase SpsE
MLDYLRNTGKPIIISSGMSTFAEIRKAVGFLRDKNKKVALLHCVSKYPCPPEELNLGTINFFKKKFGIPIGFSDHSLSIEPALVAVALGAKIIEKHFSFDRNLWGSDHKASLTPEEFKKMAAGIRKLESNQGERQKYLAEGILGKYLGRRAKVLQDGESVFRPFFRKALVASRSIPRGTKIVPELVYAMRPLGFCNGLSSDKYQDVLGKKIRQDLKKYEPITSNSFSKKW